MKEKNCVDYVDGKCGYLYEAVVDDSGITFFPEMPLCPGTEKCACYNRPLRKPTQGRIA